MLYRLTTGRLPFEGETTRDVLRAVMSQEPVAPSTLNKNLPASLENLILNCLGKDLATRYGDATELARDAAAASRRAAVERRTGAPAAGQETPLQLAQRKAPARVPSLPAATGVQALLGEEWLSRYRRRLPSTAPSVVLSAPEGLLWAYPITEARALKNAAFQLNTRQVTSKHALELRLDPPRAWKRAEVTLHNTRIETELTFRVTFNEGPALDFRHEPGRDMADPAKFRPDITLPIDPRLLKTGLNRVEVAIIPVAGTRYLGLKSYNSFVALRLAWEE